MLIRFGRPWINHGKRHRLNKPVLRLSNIWILGEHLNYGQYSGLHYHIGRQYVCGSFHQVWASFVTWCPCYVGRCTIHYPYYECTFSVLQIRMKSSSVP